MRKRHTIEGCSGRYPGNPLSISDLVPRNTKLICAKGFKIRLCVETLQILLQYTQLAKNENPLFQHLNPASAAN